MAVIASGSALSVAANSFSADQVTGQYQFTGKGLYRLYARSSATGMRVKFSNQGISPCDNQAIPYTGTAGAISKNDHLVVEQLMNGGKNELVFYNSTGGALTVDFILEHVPTK